MNMKIFWSFLLLLASLSCEHLLGLRKVELWGDICEVKTLSLTCSVSGFSITNSADCWDWIPQPPGKGLGDTSQIQFSLQLSWVMTLYTALCYCPRRLSEKS
eukprot:bmy_21398T0